MSEYQTNIFPMYHTMHFGRYRVFGLLLDWELQSQMASSALKFDLLFGTLSGKRNFCVSSEFFLQLCS
jgi:hypothetical protein